MADSLTNADIALRRAFDPDNDKIKVDATVTATIGTVDVIIDASSDNIAISDGVDTLAINSDGSINVVINPSGLATSALQSTANTKLDAINNSINFKPTLRLDQATSVITYVGEAVAGSSTSGPVWLIKKIDETSGISITYADGNTNYDNVWDSRASLTYS
jgi:hypothetical protein